MLINNRYSFLLQNWPDMINIVHIEADLFSENKGEKACLRHTHQRLLPHSSPSLYPIMQQERNHVEPMWTGIQDLCMCVQTRTFCAEMDKTMLKDSIHRAVSRCKGFLWDSHVGRGGSFFCFSISESICIVYPGKPAPVRSLLSLS